MITKEIFNDPILQRMKSDNSDTRTGFESCRQNPQPLLEGAELVIHFHTQRLKNLRLRMTPAVPADDLLDSMRQREGYSDGGRLPPSPIKPLNPAIGGSSPILRKEE